MFNKSAIEKALFVLETFYDHSVQPNLVERSSVFGDLSDEDDFNPFMSYATELLEPQAIAYSDLSMTCVFSFGISIHHQTEAPGMYDSLGETRIYNAFATVSLHGSRPKIKMFRIGFANDSVLDMLNSELDSYSFLMLLPFDEIINHTDNFEDMSYIECRDYGSLERDDPYEYYLMNSNH